jgi:anti-sigma factor RsiW
MNCAEREEQVSAWIAGTLDERDAREFERHAAECATCGARLDSLSRVANVPRELEAPPALRAATLRAVAARRPAARVRRSLAAIVGIAAVVLLAVMLRPARKSASDFPGAGKALMAMDHARPEFAELDAAERDLVGALRDRPEDPELTASLARVRRQREALRELVQQARS